VKALKLYLEVRRRGSPCGKIPPEEIVGDTPLRNIYVASGLSIRPRTSVSRLEMLKEIIRAWGLDSEKILVREDLSEPHRAIVQPVERGDDQARILAGALKEVLRKELLDDIRSKP
jgi:hypothetical protein